jgi:hypothetical protein
MNISEKEKSKKAYSSPVIRIYGNIVSLTQSRGKTNMNDGGGIINFTMTKL